MKDFLKKGLKKGIKCSYNNIFLKREDKTLSYKKMLIKKC